MGKPMKAASTAVIAKTPQIPSGASSRNAGFACFGSFTELLSDEKNQGESEMLALVEKRFKGLEKIGKKFSPSQIDYENLGGFELVSPEQFRDLDILQDALEPFAQVRAGKAVQRQRQQLLAEQIPEYERRLRAGFAVEISGDGAAVGVAVELRQAVLEFAFAAAPERPVPLGAAGLIAFAGVCVGRGYINDPERTGQAYLTDPHREGQRLYLGGDYGRWRPDGKLEFLGRRDSQVKISGFRIEIGEIENTLLRVPGVRDGAVVVAGRPGQGQRLVAFYSGP